MSIGMIEIEVTAPVHQADDGDGWHFADLPDELTEVIDRFTGGPSGAWQSVKVEATIGQTTWRTSLFLSTEGNYLLPLKQPVRRAESIAVGDDVEVLLRL